MNESCLIYEWVMSHIWMSHISCMNESCLIYEWVMSHIWMSHVSYMNESCLMFEWVMSHIWMSHVSCMNESCVMFEWVMSVRQDTPTWLEGCALNASNIWMNYFEYLNTSRLTHEWVMSHTYKWVGWRIQMNHVTCASAVSSGDWRGAHSTSSSRRGLLSASCCDMTHSYVWHDSFMRVTWLIHACDILIHMFDMTYSYVWRDSFICVTWLIHMCDVTHSHAWRDSFICVTWLILHQSSTRGLLSASCCDMTHQYA